MLISVGADEVLASDRMKCAKTNNFRLGHKLKTWSCTTTSVEHCLYMAIIRHTYHRLMHLYLQRHPPYGAYTQVPSGYIPHGPPISRLLNPCNAIFNTLVLILLLITGHLPLSLTPQRKNVHLIFLMSLALKCIPF